MRIDARLADLADDLVDEARVLELQRRQVDADRPSRRGPGGVPLDHLAAAAVWSTNRPRARIVPVSSASGMNSAGVIGPRVGWFQRTSASTPTMRPSASVDDRLVVDVELAPLRLRAQVGRQGVPLDDRAVHRRVEHLDARACRCALARYIATSALRMISSIACVAAARADAGAAADDHSVPRIRNGNSSATMIRLVIASASSTVEPSRGQDRELVAAEAGDEVAGRSVAEQPLGDRDSSWSPAAWPSVSLTILKSSRSRKTTTGDELAVRPR